MAELHDRPLGALDALDASALYLAQLTLDARSAIPSPTELGKPGNEGALCRARTRVLSVLAVSVVPVPVPVGRGCVGDQAVATVDVALSSTVRGRRLPRSRCPPP